jgi:hypothetical protein
LTDRKRSEGEQWNAFQKLLEEQRDEYQKQLRAEFVKVEEVRKQEKLELEKTRKLMEAQRRQFQDEVCSVEKL